MHVRDAVRRFVGLFTGEPLLTAVGLFGLLLAAVCGLYVLTNGAVVPPEGNVQSAFSFNAAIGIFVLSMAALLPLTDFSESRRAILRWSLAIDILIGYAIETIQHMRGINPRFTREGAPLDMLVGLTFGITSVILIVITVLIASAFFRKLQTLPAPLLHSIRYAFVSTYVAFAAGVVMIAIEGRYVGPAGNLIVLHGFGFHSLQVLPLLGWLASSPGQTRGNLLVHWGGLAWMTATVLVGVETALGRTVFALTPLPIVTAICLLECLTVIYVAAMSRRSNLPTATTPQ